MTNYNGVHNILSKKKISKYFIRITPQSQSTQHWYTWQNGHVGSS